MMMSMVSQVVDASFDRLSTPPSSVSGKLLADKESDGIPDSQVWIFYTTRNNDDIQCTSLLLMGGATEEVGDNAPPPHLWDQRVQGVQGAVQWKWSLLLQQTVFIQYCTS